MSTEIDETTDDKNAETGSTGSGEIAETPNDAAPEAAVENQATGAFDAAAVETAFGMPAGSLADCQDNASALEAVRGFTDKTLMAGLGLGGAGGERPADERPPGKQPAAKNKAATQADSGNAELDAMRAELAEVKGFLKTQQDQYTSSLGEQLNQRIDTEIDAWKSPKYGVGKTRNYRQAKAAGELRELLKTHVAGLQASGQPISQVEPLLRRVRAFDDETYSPAKPASGAASLGKPGGRQGTVGGGDKTPQTIHHALMQNWS